MRPAATLGVYAAALAVVFGAAVEEAGYSLAG